MMPSPIWVIILSAAVGSLAAAFVTFLGQVLERRSRQRELFLAKAIEMARTQNEMLRDIVDKQGGSAILRPQLEGTLEFFEGLKMVFEKTRLPDKVLAQIANEEARISAEDEARSKVGRSRY